MPCRRSARASCSGWVRSAVAVAARLACPARVSLACDSAAPLTRPSRTRPTSSTVSAVTPVTRSATCVPSVTRCRAAGLSSGRWSMTVWAGLSSVSGGLAVISCQLVRGIADPAHRPDDPLRAELRAQLGNVDVDGPGPAGRRVAPDLCEQLLAAEDAARPADEAGEQVELGGREPH